MMNRFTSPLTEQQTNNRNVSLTTNIPVSEGLTFIDSERNQRINGIGNCVATTLSGVELFGKQTDMMLPGFINSNINLYNVNPYNNTVEFISSNTGATVHSVVIPPGTYDTATALMDALIAALNTATGASGLTFSYVVNPSVGGTIYIDPLSFRLSSAGGSYYFTLNNSHTCMTYGKYLYNLPRSQILETTKNVGRVLGIYTRWLDFTSTSLTESTRIPSSSNDEYSIISLLFRLFIDSNKLVGFIEQEEARWLIKEKSKSIATADIRIFDEYGNIFYQPTLDASTEINDFYNLIFKSR
jgi:hypothetical protein